MAANNSNNKIKKVMQLMRFFLIFSIVPGIPGSLAGIVIKSSEFDEDCPLVDAAVEILRLCYQNRGNAVVVAGNPIGSLSKKLCRLYLPITLIGTSTRLAKYGPVAQNLTYKLQVFTVAVSSSKSFKSTLKEIKNSRWWNHMASVLILGWSNCEMASSILNQAWKMDLLYAKFMCIDPLNRTIIYSYNPFTNSAPHPWKQITPYHRSDHGWTLFSREYHQNEEICNELDFEKTNDLGDYKFRALVKNISGVWTTYPNMNGTDAFGSLDGKLARLLFYALRTTPNFIAFNSSFRLIPIVVDNQTVGGDIDLKNGIYDIGLNTRFAYIGYTLSKTIRESGLVVMTQHRGHMSQLGKIFTVLDRGTRIGLILVALITIIIFKFAMRQSVIQAFLNVWRIYCNSCVPNLPKCQASRIYMTSLYLIMMNIQAVYQGKMASFVTKIVAIPDAETMMDVINFGFTVYGEPSYTHIFREPIFKGKFVAVDRGNCSHHVLNDYLAACVHEKNILKHIAAELGQHVSEHSIYKSYRMYIMRPNWPLEVRINKILARLMQSGLVNHSDLEETRITLRKLELIKGKQPDQFFKTMNLHELAFAFAILGIGLILGVVSFIFEIAIAAVWTMIKNAKF